MKIFNLIQSITATTEIQQLQINLHIDDLESLIQYLHQSSDHNEITLMAEHPAENQLVLDYATKYWFGCGLYHPDLNQLNQKRPKNSTSFSFVSIPVFFHYLARVKKSTLFILY